ncbi:lysozyme inhibitor LprI family protein [Photobacterium sp. 1_MG-2023]|uniref:lysozyme inhibitor LprI family protein n=1 Tax=Photobacterium sp. 1_MG-2023 TaxID=3062646 RepID=UPI0026E122FF|nr:lysozyme inhibitor LprI family protein [Photobacterium sp. 1_MG-2023]MDO6708636.1 lysozyme inhibitor LprI family protein [Photobacterium sp. 1_MG-2023]
MKKSLLLLSFLATSAQAASFNCELASTPTEKMICTNPSLNTMDELIHQLYTSALKTSGNDTLKAEQRSWLKFRDNTCDNLAACETVFKDRINRLLIKVSQENITHLSQDMALPDEKTLDQISTDAAQNIAAEVYQPWLRKVVNETKSPNFPIATTVNNEIYIYYKKYKSSDSIYELREYKPITHEDKFIASDTQGATFVKNGVLYFYTNFSDNRVLEHHYTIGSYDTPKVNQYIHLHDYFNLPYRHNQENEKILISEDQKKIAIQTQIFLSSEDITHYSQNSQEVELFRKAKLSSETYPITEDNNIAIYDSESNHIKLMPNIMKNKANWGWEIYSMVWSEDNQSIYFDNYAGQYACVWKYDIRGDVVHKIVPEHEAMSPFPFTYQGKEFVVYILQKFPSENRLMIAMKP